MSDFSYLAFRNPSWKPRDTLPRNSAELHTFSAEIYRLTDFARKLKIRLWLRMRFIWSQNVYSSKHDAKQKRKRKI